MQSSPAAGSSNSSTVHVSGLPPVIPASSPALASPISGVAAVLSPPTAPAIKTYSAGDLLQLARNELSQTGLIAKGVVNISALLMQHIPSAGLWLLQRLKGKPDLHKAAVFLAAEKMGEPAALLTQSAGSANPAGYAPLWNFIASNNPTALAEFLKSNPFPENFAASERGRLLHAAAGKSMDKVIPLAALRLADAPAQLLDFYNSLLSSNAEQFCTHFPVAHGLAKAEEAAIIRAAFGTNSKAALQLLGRFNLEPAFKMELLEITAKADPVLASEALGLFGFTAKPSNEAPLISLDKLLPQLGLANSSALSALLKKQSAVEHESFYQLVKHFNISMEVVGQIIGSTAVRNPQSALRQARRLDVPVGPHNLAIARSLLLQGHAEFFSEFPGLSFPDAGDAQILLLAAAKKYPEPTFRYLERNPTISDATYSAVATVCAERVPTMVARSQRVQNLDSTGVDGAVVRATMARSAERAYSQYVTLGANDQKLIMDVALALLDRKPDVFFASFNFDLVQDTGDLSRLCSACAQADLRATLAVAPKFLKRQPDFLKSLCATDLKHPELLLPFLAADTSLGLQQRDQLLARIAERQPAQVIKLMTTEKHQAITAFPLTLASLLKTDLPGSLKAFERLKVAADDRIQIITLAAGIDALTTIKLINPDSLPSELRCELGCQAAQQNPSGLLPQMSRLNLKDAEALKQVALVFARHSPGRLMKNLDTFFPKGLQRNDGIQLAKALASDSPWEAPRMAERLNLRDPASLKELRIYAIANQLSRVKREAWTKDLIKDPHSLNEIIKQGLDSQQSANLLGVCEVAAKLRGERLRQVDLLKRFDADLQAANQPGALSARALQHLDLVSRIRRAGGIPSAELIKAFQYYDDKGDAFICSIIGQAGRSFGGSIVNQLMKVHRREEITSISELDKNTVLAFIHASFRGFSTRTFVMAREAMERSPRECSELLAGWKKLSAAMLTGRSISKEELLIPANVTLLYGAYRPVDMRLEDVRRLIPDIKDHSDRLKNWKFPAQGYALKLSDVGEISLRKGELLDKEALEKIIHLAKAGIEIKSTAEDAFKVIVQASQRASGQIDKGKLLAVLSSRDRRLAEGLRQISKLGDSGLTEETVYELLPIYMEVIEELVPKALSHFLDQQITKGGMPIGDPMRARLRGLLKLTPESELTNPDMIRALKEELSKVYKSELQFVNKESRKFTTRPGASREDFRVYISLNVPAFFSRASAGLCSSEDFESWDSAEYLQASVVDCSRGRIVGNIQFHDFENQAGNPALLSRINPNERFVSSVDRETLASEIMRVCKEFSLGNNRQPYTPKQTYWHPLTNRVGFAPYLEKYQGPAEKANVSVTSDYTVEEVCPLITPENKSQKTA